MVDSTHTLVRQLLDSTALHKKREAFSCPVSRVEEPGSGVEVDGDGVGGWFWDTSQGLGSG